MGRHLFCEGMLSRFATLTSSSHSPVFQYETTKLWGTHFLGEINQLLYGEHRVVKIFRACHKMAPSLFAFAAGGSPLSDEQMKRCLERAFQRHAEASKLITLSLGSTTPNLASPPVDR